jgi:hydrogenase/urease accessory protein HupE
MNWVAILVSVIALLGLQTQANAHEGRPLFIEIEERDNGALFLKWRVPSTIDQGNAPQIKLPDACKKVQLPQTAVPFLANGGQGLFNCSDLTEVLSLDLHYPRGNPSVSSLVRLIRSDGEVQIVRSGPGEARIELPSAETAGGVASEYLVLGVEHILTGYDHLLFVACLLMLAGTFKRVLIVVTGFTLAHSVTLALAALDVVRVPVPPLEAAIALSIVFVASELVRPNRDTLTWRYPVVVSGGFGLLHGFGFAAVLGEIGLPQTEVPLALLFFNVGVEIGQIGFILFLAGVFFLLSRGISFWKKQAVTYEVSDWMKPVGYVVGTLACFWTFERVVAFVA